MLAGQCAKDLPSYQEGSSEIFKRLLRPWNFKIWGSKILKEEEEKAEKERTTIVENTPRHNELKPTVKPLLVCPRLAGFSYKNHHMKESDHPSGLTPRNLYSPLFDDDKKGPVSSTGRTFEDKESSGLGVFDILCTKMDRAEIESEKTLSPRKPDSSYYPDGGVWDEIRDEFEQGLGSARVPAVGVHEKLPLGADIPTDRAEFWKYYFAPLEGCPWFPASS